MSERLSQPPTIRDTQQVMLDLKRLYAPYEQEYSPEGQPWNGYDRFVGFVGDTEKLNKVIRKWQTTPIHEVDTPGLQKEMGHHIADYLFSIFATADDFSLDLEIPPVEPASSDVRDIVQSTPIDFSASFRDMTRRVQSLVPVNGVESLFGELLGAAAKDTMGLAGKRVRSNPAEGLTKSLRGLFVTTLCLSDKYGVNIDQAVRDMTQEKSAHIKATLKK